MDVLFVLILSFGLSCENVANQSDSEQLKDTIEGTTSINSHEVALLETYDYAADWLQFKQAAKTKNNVKLASLSTEKITDFEGLSFLLSELYIIRALDQTSFTDLTMEDIDGHEYLQFYAEEIFMEEGYEYGTSLTLLFLKTDAGLRLDHYFAAG